MKTKEQKLHMRWLIDTLRAGTYKQGMGSLKTGNKFCCLGVACDIHRQATKSAAWSAMGAYLNYQATLPLEVVDYFGFESQRGFEFPEFDLLIKEPIALDYLNDVKKLSFREIADLLEKKLNENS
jgi:hypothetical protein